MEVEEAAWLEKVREQDLVAQTVLQNKGVPKLEQQVSMSAVRRAPALPAKLKLDNTIVFDFFPQVII